MSNERKAANFASVLSYTRVTRRIHNKNLSTTGEWLFELKHLIVSASAFDLCTRLNAKIHCLIIRNIRGNPWNIMDRRAEPVWRATSSEKKRTTYARTRVQSIGRAGWSGGKNKNRGRARRYAVFAKLRVPPRTFAHSRKSIGASTFVYILR